MSTTTASPCIDHVIILVPYPWLSAPPDWLARNFTLSPGGRHADAKTENRLILFQDGSYLELIAFIDDDPTLRQGHWWDKPYGVVDFCLTTKEEEFQWKSVNKAIADTGSQVQYGTPQAGGRKRPDGVDVKWLVTFPQGAERGLVPFWCHDRTPRHNRIPITADNTSHPCGAIGVSTLIVSSDSDDATTARSVMAAITRSESYEKFPVSRFSSMTGYPQPAIHLQSSQTGHGLHLELVLQIKQSTNLPQDVHELVGQGTIDISFTA